MAVAAATAYRRQAASSAGRMICSRCCRRTIRRALRRRTSRSPPSSTPPTGHAASGTYFSTAGRGGKVIEDKIKKITIVKCAMSGGLLVLTYDSS